MSPEQADGRGPVDARSDVYSLAVVVQEILGRSSMDASNPSLTSSTEVPWAAHDVLRHALARHAAERFPSSSSFEHAFSAAFTIARSRRATRRWVVGGFIEFVAPVSVAAYAVIATRGHRPQRRSFELYMRGTDQRLSRSEAAATRAAIGILGRAVAADSLFPV